MQPLQLPDEVWRSTPAMPKVDGRRSTPSEPHEGQVTLVVVENSSRSNSWPQAAQRYS